MTMAHRDGVAPGTGQHRAMRLMIVGLGMMGRAAAEVAAAELPLTRLHLVDKQLGRARDAAAALSAPGVAVTAGESWPEAAADSDVALLAIPWPQTEQVLAATRGARLAAVSIARPPVLAGAYVPDVVRARSGPALLPVGLEPGLTEILLRRVISGFDRLQEAELLCGGLTAERPPGFPYRLLFGGTTLPFAQRPAYTIVAGKVQAGERFSDVRPASLPGLPALESYLDGMVPWLHELPGTEGADIQQRTVRWPGFASAVALLRAGGFLDDDEVDVAGTRLRPRRLTDELLGRRLQRGPEEREVTHLQVTAHGPAGGRPVKRQLNVWCRDDETPLGSGMACLTAVPAVAAAALAPGRPPGWTRPDQAFDRPAVDRLLAAMTRYGVRVRESLAAGPERDRTG
jgi:saccharopine dehydrogenase-like NADP-dependent oxidoreductase